jgi:adenosylcobinamide kinase/adenosylcobinamide-phosphate guanylyltransferase
MTAAPSRLVLIGGGARSGKSSYAVRRALLSGPRRVFVATAEALDEEMRERIAAHQHERGAQFTTVEAPRDLEAALAALGVIEAGATAERTRDPLHAAAVGANAGVAVDVAVDVVVIDCLTLWLSNVLLAAQPALAERGAAADAAVAARAVDAALDARIARLASALARSAVPVLLISNEVGLGLVPESPLGRRFRDLAGRAHQRLADAAGEVYLAALGCMIRLKPGPIELVPTAVEPAPTAVEPAPTAVEPAPAGSTLCAASQEREVRLSGAPDDAHVTDHVQESEPSS